MSHSASETFTDIIGAYSSNPALVVRFRFVDVEVTYQDRSFRRSWILRVADHTGISGLTGHGTGQLWLAYKACLE
jgi:hypothetical protein